MKRVRLTNSYKYESTSYIIWVVKEIHETINGKKNEVLCFDFNLLAYQFGITKSDLEFLASTDLRFNNAMYYGDIEVDGSERTKTKKLIHADEVLALLVKVNDSYLNYELDINKEKALILGLIETVKEMRRL